MTTGDGVKLIAEIHCMQHGDESAIGGQQTFLIATGEKEKWGLRRIGRANKNKRITGATALASPGSKNGALLAVLADAFDGERAARDVQRGAEAAGTA